MIQTHSEDIVKVGGTYCGIGEGKTNRSPFQDIKCYSSTDATKLMSAASDNNNPVVALGTTGSWNGARHLQQLNRAVRHVQQLLPARAGTPPAEYAAPTPTAAASPFGHDNLDDNLLLDGSTDYLLIEDRTARPDSLKGMCHDG